MIFSSFTVIFGFAIGIVVNVALKKSLADLPELYDQLDCFFNYLDSIFGEFEEGKNYFCVYLSRPILEN